MRPADDVNVKVVTLSALAMLKVIAWTDRRANRDAYDAMLIARHYGDTGNSDRLLGDRRDLIDTFSDFRLAGAALLGTDITRIASAESHKLIRSTLTRACEYLDDGRFIAGAMASRPAYIYDEQEQQVEIELLRAVLHGLSEGDKAAPS